MRLEGLAPTYSVATALGESDSIKNQRVSTKFSRRLLPTSTFSMPGLDLLVLWPLKILVPEYADMEFVQNFTPPDFQAKNLHRWQKFYTAAGTDGMDKFHLWY